MAPTVRLHDALRRIVPHPATPARVLLGIAAGAREDRSAAGTHHLAEQRFDRTLAVLAKLVGCLRIAEAHLRQRIAPDVAGRGVQRQLAVPRRQDIVIGTQARRAAAVGAVAPIAEDFVTEQQAARVIAQPRAPADLGFPDPEVVTQVAATRAASRTGTRVALIVHESLGDQAVLDVHARVQLERYVHERADRPVACQVLADDAGAIREPVRVPRAG